MALRLLGFQHHQFGIAFGGLLVSNTSVFTSSPRSCALASTRSLQLCTITFHCQSHLEAAAFEQYRVCCPQPYCTTKVSGMS